MMYNLPSIPTEIWEYILDLLDRDGLLSFQQVCNTWYEISMKYVMSGRLKNRALVSQINFRS